MMGWDALPEVVSPYGVPISRLLEEAPRRQNLPGFDPVYRDFVDYIMRCTHRIWEEKNVGLCRTHYGQDVVMHTLAGPASGIESVVQGTITALAMSSDRQVIGEDVIWSADPDGRLYSSHRITSQMTHLGDDPMLGPAKMCNTGATTIADCAVVANRIVEEWLVRDNARAVLQVGGDPWKVAQAQAALDREGDQDRHAWRKAAIGAARNDSDCVIPDGHPAEVPAQMLSSAWRDALLGEAAAALSVACEVRWPTNRVGYGRGYWIGCVTQVSALLHDRDLRIEHIAARLLPGGDVAVALRWSLVGVHAGTGLWGPPTGRTIYLMAVSHYRLRGARIIEDTTVFDELALLRQIAGGLGA